MRLWHTFIKVPELVFAVPFSPDLNIGSLSMVGEIKAFLHIRYRNPNFTVSRVQRINCTVDVPKLGRRIGIAIQLALVLLPDVPLVGLLGANDFSPVRIIVMTIPLAFNSGVQSRRNVPEGPSFAILLKLPLKIASTSPRRRSDATYLLIIAPMRSVTDNCTFDN